MRLSLKFLGYFLRENENTAKQTQLYDDNFSPSWKEIARSLGLQMFTGIPGRQNWFNETSSEPSICAVIYFLKNLGYLLYVKS